MDPVVQSRERFVVALPDFHFNRAEIVPRGVAIVSRSAEEESYQHRDEKPLFHSSLIFAGVVGSNSNRSSCLFSGS